MIKQIYKIAKLAMLMTLLFSFVPLFAQNFSELDNSPVDIETFPRRGNDKVVKVVYSRPQVNGREVMGNLVKYGKIWRTGANEATEITFYKEVKIGSKKVKAGTYTLFTIPEKDHWTVILNSELNQWGAYTYNEANDVLRIKATVSKSPTLIEAFSITLEKSAKGANLYMGWENTIVTLPIEF
jgi:hypothetical protein